MTKWASVLAFGIAFIFGIQAIGLLFGFTVSPGVVFVALIISMIVLIHDGLNAKKEYKEMKVLKMEKTVESIVLNETDETKVDVIDDDAMAEKIEEEKSEENAKIIEKKKIIGKTYKLVRESGYIKIKGMSQTN